MENLTSFGQAMKGKKWKTSVFTLYKQPGLLISSICFPCGAYRQAGASFEREPPDWCESVCAGFCCLCGFDMRSRFREKYGLRGNELQDFCIQCWCNPCGLAQIRREALLWNAERQSIPTPYQQRQGQVMMQVVQPSPNAIELSRTTQQPSMHSGHQSDQTNPLTTTEQRQPTVEVPDGRHRIRHDSQLPSFAPTLVSDDLAELIAPNLHELDKKLQEQTEKFKSENQSETSKETS